MSNILERFFQRFDMKVRDSYQTIAKMKPQTIPLYSPHFSNVVDSTCYVERLNCVEILMPRDRLQTIAELIDYYESFDNPNLHGNELIARMRADEQVRLNNPTVKAAYEKYRTLLELCRK